MVMRRFDVWVGRIAAIVGIVYVLLASLWPLTASADEEHAATATLHAFIDHDEATIEMLPLQAALIDVRIGRVIAEIVGRRDRSASVRSTKTRRRSVACAASPSDDDRVCDEASAASLLPDSSTMTMLVIPLGALALAAASTLRGRGLPMA